MCDIYASIRYSAAGRLVIDGRFAIAPDAQRGSVVNLMLAVFADGTVGIGGQAVATNTPKPLLHYLSFEVSNRRLLGFKFGIDFTSPQADALAAVLCDAVAKARDELQRLLSDANDAVATLQTILRGLCTHLPAESVVRHLIDQVAAGEGFPRIVHAPHLIADGFAATVDASNQFRLREEARAA